MKKQTSVGAYRVSSFFVSLQKIGFPPQSCFIFRTQFEPDEEYLICEQMQTQNESINLSD